jgi:hypothetical protein
LIWDCAEINYVKFRGVLDVRPVEEQLGYRIQYREIRAGRKEYADRLLRVSRFAG